MRFASGGTSTWIAQENRLNAFVENEVSLSALALLDLSPFWQKDAFEAT
jgi:hypothetical protein